MNTIKSSDVQIRNFTPDDIESLASYWAGNSDLFWRERGVDKSKLASKEQFLSVYQKAFADKGDVPHVAVVEFQNTPIGVHTLTNIVSGDCADLHAHFWSDSHRGLGIGLVSGIKASEFFMYKLGLKRILYKVDKKVFPPNRVLEKMGVRKIGEEPYQSPVFLGIHDANVYELTLDELASMKKRHGII